MSKPKFSIVVVLLLGLGSAFYVSRSRSTKLGAAEIKKDTYKAQATPTAVAVTRAMTEELSSELSLTAEFRPYQEVELHAKVAGYLKQIFVDVGDRVDQGQLLATLEIPEMNDEAAQAAAAKRRSEAEVLRAKGELERAASAHEATHMTHNRLSAVLKARPNLVAQQEIDEAFSRDRISEAQVSSARANIEAAEQQVAVAQAVEQRVSTLAAYSRITAPFAGVITKRYAVPGAMIQAGTASQSQAMPVVRLSQTSSLRLVLAVPESVAPRIRKGASVEVRVSSLDRTFQGTVSRFSSRVQAATRTMETEIDVPNPGFLLMPGMYAEASLTLERRNVLAVPMPAVSARQSGASVLVVNAEKRIEERPVKLGMETAEKVEITAGLARGELVVVGSRAQLRPGQLVEPKAVDMVASGTK